MLGLIYRIKHKIVLLKDLAGRSIYPEQIKKGRCYYNSYLITVLINRYYK